MAYTQGNLYLVGSYPANASYNYDAGSDTMATVHASGYFKNSDSADADIAFNLTVDDLIWCQCGDGNMWLRVSAISSGSVTTQYAGGNLPIQTLSTGTAVALGAVMESGLYDIGTSVSTATRVALRVPYPGAEIIVNKADTGTRIIHFDAGNSATAAQGTSVVYNANGDRRFLLRYQGEGFHVVGSSTSRWRIISMNMVSTYGSATAGYGASLFLIGT